MKTKQNTFDVSESKNIVTRWELGAGVFAFAVFGVLTLAVWLAVRV